MALPTASDNVFTRFLISEGGSTTTPAANRVTIYAKADGLLYQKDDAGVETLLAGGDAAAHIADAADAHDASAVSVLDTATNFTGTDVEAVLAELQDNIDGVSAGTGVSYYSRRVVSDGANASQTLNVNSTSYASARFMDFYHDWDFFPATHFHISCFGNSSEAAQTVTLQLATSAVPATPYSAAGNDLAIANGVAQYTSGWVAVSGTPSGHTLMSIAFKGSNTTVDLAIRWIDIAFKIV